MIALPLCFVSFELVVFTCQIIPNLLQMRSESYNYLKTISLGYIVWLFFHFVLCYLMVCFQCSFLWLPIEVSCFINNWIDFQYRLLLPWKQIFSGEIGSSLCIYFLICIYLEGFEAQSQDLCQQIPLPLIQFSCFNIMQSFSKSNWWSAS